MAELVHPPLGTESSIQEQLTKAISQEENAPAIQKTKAGKQFFGELVNFGVAKFNFSEKEKESFFVNLKNINGQEKTVWGIDLNRAIKESGVKIGQYVTLDFEGKQPLTIDKPNYDKEGKVTGFEKYDTYRNQWSVRKATEKEKINPVLESQPADNIAKNLTESPQHLFAVNKETGEVSILSKDEQGKSKLQDPTKPINPDYPAFELIPQKGFLGNFIINFKNNYKNSSDLEILAVPISKPLETAAQEITESLPDLKANSIKGLETLNEKTGISGITDKTERTFINFPEAQQQKILGELENDPKEINAYTLKQKNGRYQMPDDESVKTSFRTDLKNFIHLIKDGVFKFPEQDKQVNKPTNLQTTNTNQMQAPKFNPEHINWKDAEKLGLTRDLLEKTDNMKKLLNGEKTALFQGLKGDLGGVKISIDGKFRLVENPAGQPTFVFHGVRAALDIPKTYLGYQFSEEDKQILKEAGNLNKQVTLLDKSTNTEFKAYIGVDKETKELVAIRADRIKIPNMLKGVLLSEEQKQLLEQGKPAEIAGMKDDKNQEFSATVQIDPAKKGFSFRPISDTAIKETVKPENKIQVAANNDGNKTESVKHINTVKSQQQKEPKLKITGNKRRGPKL